MSNIFRPVWNFSYHFQTGLNILFFRKKRKWNDFWKTKLRNRTRWASKRDFRRYFYLLVKNRGPKVDVEISPTRGRVPLEKIKSDDLIKSRVSMSGTFRLKKSPDHFQTNFQTRHTDSWPLLVLFFVDFHRQGGTFAKNMYFLQNPVQPPLDHR